MEYIAEVRVFEEDGMDYINDSVVGNDWKETLKTARWYGKQLGGKIKINILKKIDEEDGWWCFFSKTYYFGKEK